MKKGYKSCPYCGEEIREIAKKCRFCGEFLEENKAKKEKEKQKSNIVKGDKNYSEGGTSGDTNVKSNIRNREELTEGEQKYISKKLAGRRIFTVFLTQWGLIRCKRWGDLSWYLIIGLILILTLPPIGFIFCIIARIIVLYKFSEKAYKHDMPYFQKYLEKYAELYGRKNSK